MQTGIIMKLTDAEYMAIAASHPAWGQTRASFALEGIELDVHSQILAGRQIAGHATAEEVVAELDAMFGVTRTPEQVFEVV